MSGGQQLGGGFGDEYLKISVASIGPMIPNFWTTFDSGWPTNWPAPGNIFGNIYWGACNYRYYGASGQSAWCARTNNPGYQYVNGMYAYFYTPSANLRFINLHIEFDYWQSCFDYGDYFTLEGYDGTTFIVLLEIHDNTGSQWVHVNYECDWRVFKGGDAMQFRFIFVSNTGGVAEGTYIDNFFIECG